MSSIYDYNMKMQRYFSDKIKGAFEAPEVVLYDDSEDRMNIDKDDVIKALRELSRKLNEQGVSAVSDRSMQVENALIDIHRIEEESLQLFIDIARSLQ